MTLNDTELAILQNVPVPQADDLDKVFEVAELVEQGVNTAGELADHLGMVGRQGLYYAEAAVALRLVSVTKDMTAEGNDRFSVTPLGKDYLEAEPDRRRLKRRSAVLNSPILKYVSSRLGITQNGAVVPYPPPGELFDEARVVPILNELGITGRTVGRRVHTIEAWLKSLE